VLKDKTAERITEALESFLAKYHLSGSDIMAALLNSPLPPEGKKYARIGLKAGIKASFTEFPEPTKEKLLQVLAMINALKEGPHQARTLFMKVAKDLPHAPGGPLKKIKSKEEATVCAEIIALRAEMDTREAIRRVASKHGVSERTIYRIWGKYFPKKRKLSQKSGKT
jgi:hypothetical protein